MIKSRLAKGSEFLANSQTGNAKGTLELLDHLKSVLQGIDTEAVSVLITASPVYKVRSFINGASKKVIRKLSIAAKRALLELKKKFSKCVLS